MGIPITINKGGINPVKIVISNPNKDNIPIDHTTPTVTTNIEYIVALNDLKNKYNIKEVINIESAKNILISEATLVVELALIKGNPDL